MIDNFIANFVFYSRKRAAPSQTSHEEYLTINMMLIEKDSKIRYCSYGCSYEALSVGNKKNRAHL